jgi:hypothetical protein
MKSFLELTEEKKKSVAMLFGRMNPPTRGHEENIEGLKTLAAKNHADHLVVASHSHDSKKNPLTPAQKLKHLNRAFPGTNITTSSKEHPTIMHIAAHLHSQGYNHLIVAGGGDRAKEYQRLLNHYNGVAGKHGFYKFNKIEVKSTGERKEGVSGTDMRKHVMNGDYKSFKAGLPSHMQVNDKHAKDLFNDVRKGMGINEDVNHGLFKAIFVTGGPGSGKDVIVREAIAESKLVELNYIQAKDYLSDKHKLAESSKDQRREAIRARGPLVINGPADDINSIGYIKEELEELGYQTMMVFVDTTNDVSKERNSLLSRMMMESIRYDKWVNSQNNIRMFYEMFNDFKIFDNTGNIDTKIDDISDIFQSTTEFFGRQGLTEAAQQWMKHNRILNIYNRVLFKESKNVKKDAKSIQTRTVLGYNKNYRPSAAKGPADIKPDNSGSLVPAGEHDSIKGLPGPRKDPNGKTTSGGAWHGAYNFESAPTIKWNPQPKEPNFNYDKDKIKKQKRGDKSLSAGRVARPAGVGPEYDTRAGGQGAAAGAGLGQAIGETQEYSNASQNGTAMPGSKLEPNPLAEKKPFDKFRSASKKNIKEYKGFQNDVESGLGGTLNGADNKELMDTYKDPNRHIGIQITKKKNKRG